MFLKNAMHHINSSCEGPQTGDKQPVMISITWSQKIKFPLLLQNAKLIGSNRPFPVVSQCNHGDEGDSCIY